MHTGYVFKAWASVSPYSFLTLFSNFNQGWQRSEYLWDTKFPQARWKQTSEERDLAKRL